MKLSLALPLKMAASGVLLICLALQVNAGQVTVRKSSEPAPVDPWALKRELVKQYQWEEQLRRQNALNWLYQLPPGCLMLPEPMNYYHCGSQYYRPYQHQGQQMYIEVDKPAQKAAP